VKHSLEVGDRVRGDTTRLAGGAGAFQPRRGNTDELGSPEPVKPVEVLRRDPAGPDEDQARAVGHRKPRSGGAKSIDRATAAGRDVTRSVRVKDLRDRQP